MTKFQELYDFIDRAKRSRKYTDATAVALRASLKLYDAELNDEERSSIEKFRENFEPITKNVFSKNSSKSTVGSLMTYKSRVLKTLNDFEKYGDPVKMNSWTPKILTRTSKNLSSKKSKREDDSDHSVDSSALPSAGMNKIELSIRPDTKCLIIVPWNLKKHESDRIKIILESLIAD